MNMGQTIQGIKQKPNKQNKQTNKITDKRFVAMGTPFVLWVVRQFTYFLAY